LQSPSPMGRGGSLGLTDGQSHGPIDVSERADDSDTAAAAAKAAAAECEAASSSASCSLAVEYIVFLIRHGEAAHNVKEQRAKDDAKAECVARGLDVAIPETKSAMEEARKAVLHDDGMADPGLSSAGKQCAAETRARIDELITGKQALPTPSRVLVSPLQRTLQTAALVFEGHGNVRACEELRERQTGLACDQRSSAQSMCKRLSFKGIDFAQLLSIDDGDGGTASPSSGVEDKAMLRTRTNKAILELLEGAAERCVALVTHKGYLRELERGPLCQPDATECANGEVRIYQIAITRTADGQRSLLASRLA